MKKQEVKRECAEWADAYAKDMMTLTKKGIGRCTRSIINGKIAVSKMKLTHTKFEIQMFIASIEEMIVSMEIADGISIDDNLLTEFVVELELAIEN